MKILFFASENCAVCKEVLENLYASKILKDHEFEYIDAEADDMQDCCDEHNVDLLPHLKIYSNGKLVMEKLGAFTPNEIKKYLSEKNLHNIFKL